MDDSIEQERIQADGDQVWDLVTQPGGWVPDDGKASGYAAFTTAGAVQIFAALADPTRGQLLELLGGSPERSASALACLVPVSRQAVAQHLATLEECGLVQRRRAGREVLFSVRPDRLAATACWLADRADAWRSRLEFLGREARDADRR